MDMVESLLIKSRDQDFSNRCDAVEELGKYLDNPKAYECVVAHLDDKNYLVRCEASDTLVCTVSPELFQIILTHLESEKDSMVRMHLLTNVFNHIDELGCDSHTRKRILKLYKKEKAKRAIVAYQMVLYLIMPDEKYV